MRKLKTGKVVLVDYMWMMYRSFYAFRELKAEQEFTGVYFGLTRLVQTIPPDYTIVFCKDGYPAYKYSLYEKYKEGRNSSEKDFSPNKCEDVENIVSGDNRVFFAYDPEREADEIMAVIAIYLKEKGKEVIVDSCLRTGFMRAFKTKEGWESWVDVQEQRFQEMKNMNLKIKEVWPQKIINNDLSEIKSVIEWTGLEFREKEVREFISPELWNLGR